MKEFKFEFDELINNNSIDRKCRKQWIKKTECNTVLSNNRRKPKYCFIYRNKNNIRKQRAKMVSQSATCKVSTRCASAFCPTVCPSLPPVPFGAAWRRPLVPGATHVDCPCRDYASCPSHTQTHTYTPGQLYVESGQLRGLRFKNISKCDASVFYLRKCLAQTQRYKYIYPYTYICLCVHVCVC